MKRNILILLTLIGIMSCAKNEINENGAKDQISFNVNYPGTKVTSSAFESGDMISLYAVEYNGAIQMPLQVSGNYINNEKLAFDGTSWTPDRTLYWSENSCDFYAFYP